MKETNDKRMMILDAAGELFSKSGYHLTSMKDVADKAGIAVGTIYLYYKTKEDLLDGIYEYASSLLLERIKAELARLDDPMARLRKYIEESIDFGIKYPYYFLIVFVDLRRKAVEFPKSVMYAFFQSYLSIGNGIIEAARERGQIVCGEDRDVIYGITGFWGSYVLREIFKPGFAKVSRKKKREEIYRLFEETVLRGLSAV